MAQEGKAALCMGGYGELLASTKDIVRGWMELLNVTHTFFGQEAELQGLEVSCHVTGAEVGEAGKQLCRSE